MVRRDWWMLAGARWVRVARWVDVVGPRSWSQPWVSCVVAASRAAASTDGAASGQRVATSERRSVAIQVAWPSMATTWARPCWARRSKKSGQCWVLPGEASCDPTHDDDEAIVMNGASELSREVSG